MKKLEDLYHQHQKFFQIIFIILIVTVSIYGIYTGRRAFNRRNVRAVVGQINSYGILSPVIIFLLILANTLIPPLPIPVPLIEVAAGLMFGFWPGVILVWITQMIASIAAFSMTKFTGKKLFKKLFHNEIMDFYRHLIERKGPIAVLVIRALLASPFNISFVAGVEQMDNLKFIIATALGVIPEVTLFVYLGVLITHTRIRLWYVLVLLTILGIMPLVISMLVKLFQKKQKIQKKPKLSKKHRK